LILGLAVPLWLDGFLKSAPIYQSPRMSAISVAATTGGWNPAALALAQAVTGRLPVSGYRQPFADMYTGR
jgi:hypothetical protein